MSKKYNGEIISDALRRDMGEDIEYFNRKNDGSSLRRLREDIRQRFEQVLKNIKIRIVHDVYSSGCSSSRKTSV